MIQRRKLVEIRSLHDVLRNESYVTVLKKQQQKNNKNDRIFSLAWNIVYWLLKSHCFEFFGGRKYSLFWAKKLMEKWHLLITEKFLFWTFPEWEIWSFFETKVREKMVLLITKMLLFWIFRGWKIRYFLRQKVDEKMILTG